MASITFENSETKFLDVSHVTLSHLIRMPVEFEMEE